MKNRKKSDGRKGERRNMAAVDDLYHRRLLGTIQSISPRNAEQEPAGLNLCRGTDQKRQQRLSLLHV